MSANLDFQKVNARKGLQGFSNLASKERGAWWGTRRWWINALLWTVLLAGLTTIMLFAPNEEANEATAAELAQAGGLDEFIIATGLSVFFEFGMPILAIATVVLAQDLIIGERQSGMAEWLLSKPLTRRAYILAKAFANAPPLLFLLVGLPSIFVYGALSLRVGNLYPVLPFLSAIGIMVLNIIFYFTLTLMLGTIFNHRAPILGIALASILGGGLLGGFINQFYYISPWMFPKLAWVIAAGQAISLELALASLIATAVWSVIFVLVALAKFEKVDF